MIPSVLFTHGESCPILQAGRSYGCTGFPASARVILQALQTYGMIVADNGGDWFISGTPDPRWNDVELNTLKQVPGSAFEVVQMGTVVTQ